MKKFGILILIILIAFVAVGLTSIKKPDSVQEKPSQAKNDAVPTAIIKNVMITKSGFSPNLITINRGETVKWINDSGNTQNVNSDPYPDNSLHPFLNLGEIPNGYSSDALFEDSGTYKYHNQKSPAQTGTVVVK